MSTIGLIIKREYIERIRSRSFIIGTSIVVLLMILLAFLPLLFPLIGSSLTSKIVVVAPDAALAKSIAAALSDPNANGSSYAVTIAKEAAKGPELPPDLATKIKAKIYDAALVAYYTPQGLAFTFYPRQANLLEKTSSLKSRLQHVVVDSDLSGQTAASAKRALNFPFKMITLNERYKSENEESLANLLVLLLIVLLYTATLIYGAQVASGVVEEKANRVMEVMIGAVRPAQLLTGKIFGIGAVALTQMVIFACAAAVAGILLVMVVAGTMSHADALALAHQASAAQAGAGGPASAQSQGMQAAMAGAIPVATLVYLVIFFLLGFFSYAALYAGVGSLCSKSEDVQQYQGIMMIPIILAYFVALFGLSAPDQPLVVWASMIPLLSPMVMFTRVAISAVPLWQIAVSIALSLVAIWGFTLLAAKLYRVGVLMYGKPPKLVDVWRAIRAPS